VLFIGGKKMASVQIRCVDIAKKLGCDYILGQRILGQCDLEEICDRYAVFVCVKPSLAPGQLKTLARKGRVIWDIIDSPPPEDHVDTYLASTQLAKEVFKNYGRIVVVPHHHCNFNGAPNPPDLRQPGWIGGKHWRPRFYGLDCDYYDVDGLSQAEVVKILHKIGIGLNYRKNRPSHYPAKYRKLMHDFHIAINSGIKLINCIGFGTPSISADEPAYHEIGEKCTIISGVKKCAYWVHALQNDRQFYAQLRKECTRRSGVFSIDAISLRYQRLFETGPAPNCGAG